MVKNGGNIRMEIGLNFELSLKYAEALQKTLLISLITHLAFNKVDVSSILISTTQSNVLFCIFFFYIRPKKVSL